MSARGAGRGPREAGLALYGLTAVVGGYLFTVLGLIAWRHRLGPFVHRHVPAPWDVVVLLSLIVLVTFPVWVRLTTWLRRKLRKRVVAPAPRADGRGSRHDVAGAGLHAECGNSARGASGRVVLARHDGTGRRSRDQVPRRADLRPIPTSWSHSGPRRGY